MKVNWRRTITPRTGDTSEESEGCAFRRIRPVSSAGRAFALQARGRRFESVTGHQICGNSSTGGAPSFQVGCCGFESRFPLQYAGVVEWQTRGTQNPLVAIPCGFKSHHRHQGVSALNHSLAPFFGLDGHLTRCLHRDERVAVTKYK